MSDAVFELYDASGRLSVSAGLLGFVCRASGTGTSRNRTSGNTNPSTLLVDVTAYAYPMVVIRMDGYAAAFAGQSVITGRTYANFACSAPVGVGFSWYAFDWSPTLPAHSTELQLFDASSRCTFSNRYWPLKLIGTLDGGAGGSASALAGTALAFACSGFGGHSHCESPACYDSGQADFDNLNGCNDVRGQIDGKLYGAQTDGSGATVTAAQVSYDDVIGSFGTYSDYQARYGSGWEVANFILLVDVAGIPVGTTFF